MDEEKLLERFVKDGVPAVEISKRLGRSIVGVRDKISHLGLKDDKGEKLTQPSSLSSSSLHSDAPKTNEGSSFVEALPDKASNVEPSPPLQQSSPASLVSPEAVSSPKEALQKVAAALAALDRPGLSRNEIQRLKSIISGSEKYLGLFERVAQIRRLEERMFGLERKFFEADKKQQTA